MIGSDLEFYRCPACLGRLALERKRLDSYSAVDAGTLKCERCGKEYAIINAIPRFVPPNTYADSFGLEWTNFAKTQLDNAWQGLYRTRFFHTTDFPHDMRGETLLEAGCGPGTFTGLILETGVRLFSVDLSTAVDACLRNHRNDKNADNLSVSQADLRYLPFAPASFDKVVCLGVIQHCPNPKHAFRSLCQYLKPGGEVVIDCYLKESLWAASWSYLIKHALRIVTKRMPEGLLLACVNTLIATLYDIKSAISKLPGFGSRLHRIIAIGELQRHGWTPTEMKQIKALNVFDMLSPKYDNPQSLEEIRNWIKDEGLELIKCEIGYNGVNAKARKPHNCHTA